MGGANLRSRLALGDCDPALGVWVTLLLRLRVTGVVGTGSAEALLGPAKDCSGSCAASACGESRRAAECFFFYSLIRCNLCNVNRCLTLVFFGVVTAGAPLAATLLSLADD